MSEGSEFSGIPLNPQDNVRACSTEKRRRVIFFYTFCWLKSLRMHFDVKNFLMHFCRFIQNVSAGVSNTFLRRGVSIKFSANKMYKKFYSTTLFRTVGSDVVLWVQRDSWKFWAHTRMWARSDFSLSLSSQLFELVSASRWGESCHTREWVMAHI